ncbi:alpha-ketoglutarate-dependent dioxygenase AlkB [Mumia sp. zg.B21]|uniref:alpha-ketoglutarate-dependent dioxygenase AlkB n=1 Tax=Mumia sp. zg.B21 TaxID=2855447 RepID=UPI001C6DE842|nr:alpha-ketoglutarate-dependent dioxygenase AlkB [Mumia sp. zg.B21]MBW9210464.1 alpha-ketoglutarate-dependent dioxygenase AlkB [Mumia sp. zg.B21]
MSVQFQGSLFDSADEPTLGPLKGQVVRHDLADGAWVDVRPHWVDGADDLFAHLHDTVSWRADEREMYERVVAVPRLLAWFGERSAWPHPALDEARERLGDHYETELGGRFATAGLCLYRDGRDSVAWHGDRIGRSRTQDTMVAILSLGSPRRLALRPRGGGSSLSFTLGSGDLLVMGGSCQRTWEHAIPKTSKPVGPRISVQLRPRGVG